MSRFALVILAVATMAFATTALAAPVHVDRHATASPAPDVPLAGNVGVSMPAGEISTATFVAPTSADVALAAVSIAPIPRSCSPSLVDVAEPHPSALGDLHAARPARIGLRCASIVAGSYVIAGDVFAREPSLVRRE